MYMILPGLPFPRGVTDADTWAMGLTSRAVRRMEVRLLYGNHTPILYTAASCSGRRDTNFRMFCRP